jgi:hypothetical protein
LLEYIPQIRDLICCHRIETGLQQGLKVSSIISKSILLSSCFSIAVLLTNPHHTARRKEDTAINPCVTGPAAWRCSPRSVSPHGTSADGDHFQAVAPDGTQSHLAEGDFLSIWD